MLKRFVKLIFHIYLILKHGHFKGLKMRSKKGEMLCWICPSKNYWFSDNFLKDAAMVSAFSRRGISVSIVLGKKIGIYSDRKIFFSYNRGTNVFRFHNYLEIQNYLTKNLENQRNRIFPSSHEMSLWENKSLMHQRFNELGINTPRTLVVRSKKEVEESQLDFPFLIKEEHSFSSNGIHLIKGQEDLDRIIDEDFMKRNKNIIAQSLINMRRDLRVILVGKEIVLHYWRINKDKDWKPTATGYGSDVDFITFPEKWRKYIEDTFQKLNLVTGAFDIAWENDDLETEPLILEISPNYQPNPAVDLTKLKTSYGGFKKKIGLRANSYTNLFVKTIFSHQEKIVEHLVQVDKRFS